MIKQEDDFMHHRNRFYLLIGIFMSLIFFVSGFSQKREDIDNKYKWNLSDIYPDWNAWETGFNALQTKMDEFANLKGTLSQGPEALLKAFQLSDELDVLAMRVYQYPKLTRDTDSRNQDVSARFQQVGILFSKFGTATSWFNPELLEIPWDTMKTWLDETPGLAPYRFGIEDLYRQQAHVLSADKEKLLSYYSNVRRTPADIYSELSTSDIQFPKITLTNGDTVQVTRGTYSRILATDRNQDNRREAFEAHYGVFKANENTYAAIYNGICLKDWASAQTRGYNSTLEADLDGDNVPVSVYENLIKTVRENTAPLKKYYELRKKALNLQEYHLYDGAIPLVDLTKTYPFEEAKDWTLAAVKPLGKDYQEKLKKALNGGWIDVYENDGKRAGAFSTSVYGVHPYMLLNYNGTLDYVFTLAHELGHSMHTMYATENQPKATADYTIFVAEVASTLNESLLLDYLMEKSKDSKERIMLLQQAIDNIAGTFYAQVMFADFELQAHRLAEEGKPITVAVLNGIVRDLYKTYYGESIVYDDLYDVLWSRIPHFYRTPYYVYQYATCFASSAQIHKEMTTGSKKERQATLDRYLNLLKSGGNDYPMNQLKKAGVDLNTPEPVLAVVKQLDLLVNQLQTELEKL